MFVAKSRTVALVGRFGIAALAILLSSSIGQAASVVIDEAGMNAIYSQDSFGDTPISIRFNAPRQIVAPELLSIDSEAELEALYSLAQDPAPTVVGFFVDKLNICPPPDSDVNGLWNGCAQLGGRFFVLDYHAAEIYPDTLMAHELGHNLKLEHTFIGLMTFFIPHGTELFDYEVATILQSPLVQTDSTGHRFIQITPIAIVDAPEPSTLLLSSAALGALLIFKTKRS